MGNRKTDRGRKASEISSRLILIMVGLLCVSLAFGLGFLARGSEELLARFGFDISNASEKANPGMTVSGSTYDSLSARLAEVQGVLSTDSLDAYDLDDATAKVLSAMTDAVADPYVRYYDPVYYAAYLKDVSGSYADTGILFGEYRDKAYAVDVFPGSEAEAKGVQPGDFVVAIDGDRGNNGSWTQAETVKATSREEDASVVMTWRRPATLDADGGNEFTVTLTCAPTQQPNVSTKMEGNVGYIKLVQLTQNARDMVAAAIDELTGQGAESLVLDLRDNPGGYLTQAVEVSSLFIRSGVIVGIQTKEGMATRNATGEASCELPLVVLVNESTSGSAEVIAGALQDNKRATVLGRKTMGKGSVQSITELSWGGALRYTSAFYKTPLGYDINEVGIQPDVDVAMPVDAAEDTQLTLALEAARAFVTGQS